MEVVNFLPEAAVGCHVATVNSSWIVGYEELEVSEDVDFPDVAIDPSSRLLTFTNTDGTRTKCIYTTVQDVQLEDERGAALQMGKWRDADGATHACTTFIAVLPPGSLLDVCFFSQNEDIPNLSDHIHSDVSFLDAPLQPPLSLEAAPPANHLLFPLVGDEAFLCTQGFGGAFTHFYPQTYHAVDFRCGVGTPLVAVADGVVVRVQQTSSVSGIHTRNLFDFNAVTLRLLDGRAVDYVHIRPHSCAVVEGSVVRAGDVLCESGDVGFCPEPHLHIQLLASTAARAESLPLAFRAVGGAVFVPKAGKRYSRFGEAR